MTKENNIFLAGGVLYSTWPKQCIKNIPQHLFGAIHLVRTYLMTDFSTPSPCTYLYTFSMTPSPLPCCYGWPILNQKTNKNIQIPHSLKYNHSKKKLFAKK